jgi:branched-chain amino acid transport system ATP-binding protein
MSTETSTPTGAETNTETLLRIEDLTVDYGAAPVLSGVNLEVPRGRITTVLGANGAGKTTLLKTISGMLRPSKGRIMFDGRTLGRTPPELVVRRGIAHVPEHAGVIVELSVEENLRLGALWRSGGAVRTKALNDTYALFPALYERRAQSASTLSGGERQMLAIGRALMAEPRLLLLDEPSLGLAPLVTRKIMELIRELRDDNGLTVLLVEQNVNSALSVADHGVVLSRGTVAVSDDAESLRADDQTRHAYLGF